MAKTASPVAPAPFAGFTPQTLAFFKELADFQDRAWFAEHKPHYEQFVLAPLQSLVVALSEKLSKAGLPLRGDPHGSVFRLNRDVRFSKDKRPYKTYASALITRDGGKKAPGGLYVHIDPAGSFAAAGFFGPEPQTLVQMRTHLAADPAGWQKVERALAKGGLALMSDDALVRAPKGFEQAPAAAADGLKLKSWYVRTNIAERRLFESALVDDITAFAVSAAPVLRFGWAAVDGG